jgi:YD repeat-containing protein
MIIRVKGRSTYAQTFDAENRLISVAVGGQTTQFIYDGDGNLVKKVKPDNSKTIYPSTSFHFDVGISLIMLQRNCQEPPGYKTLASDLRSEASDVLLQHNAASGRNCEFQMILSDRDIGCLTKHRLWTLICIKPDLSLLRRF